MPVRRLAPVEGGSPPTFPPLAAPRPQALPATEHVDILGVPVHRLDRAGARAQIARLAARPGHDVVAFVNAHASNLAAADPGYRVALHRASLVLNDGMGPPPSAVTCTRLLNLFKSSGIMDWCHSWVTTRTTAWT